MLKKETSTLISKTLIVCIVVTAYFLFLATCAACFVIGNKLENDPRYLEHLVQ